MKCIYKITNTINGKCYIGSSKNFKKRKQRHLKDLRKNEHHCIYLQRSFNKYDEKNFIFDIIEETHNLFEREQFWINSLKPKYNIGSVGGGDKFTNHPNKEKLRVKLSEQLRNAPNPKPRYKEDNPNWKGGVTFCKCGSRIKSKNNTCASCRDMKGVNNPFFGKHHSQETKNKLSKSKTGKLNGNNSKKIKINGVIYPSVAEASRILNVKLVTLAYRARNNIMNHSYIKCND